MPLSATARKHRPGILVEKPVPGRLDVEPEPASAPMTREEVEWHLAWAKENDPEGYAEVQALLAWKPPTHVSFLEFAKRTVTFKLDPWQEHLCERLGRLDKEKGQRILLCAGPQLGKSIFVSQRFPAWYLGVHPTDRVRLACYNIEHATRFGGIVRDLLKGNDFRGMFPNAGLKLPPVCSAEEWTTAARGGLQDSQASFKALGLVSGFVGSGCELLVVDDPYRSPQDAYSGLVRESVWTFWQDSAKPRLGPESNVVVMFHRYHQDDLSGRLIDEGGWELLRYAAQADGEPDCMPPDRPLGAFLSPRFPASWWEDKQKNAMTWLSQFQGKPAPKEGAFFDIDKLECVEAVPTGMRRVRSWDLASTAHAGDYSVGAKVEGPDAEGRFYVTHVERGRWATDERNRRMRQTALTDEPGTVIRLAQDPGQAGKDQALALTRMLAGYNVKAVVESGSKQIKADPFSAQVNAGNVRYVRGDWNRAMLDELATFPFGTNDDIVDAASGGFTELASRRIARIA